jgi:hypothetical protein
MGSLGNRASKVAMQALRYRGISGRFDGRDGHGAAAPLHNLRVLELYSNFMSTHLETSDPRPEAMVMQPRTRCAVLSLAHIA